MVNIALLGHGVVGSGVVKVLTDNRETIAENSKRDINIKYILDLRDFDNLAYAHKFVKDVNVILEDETVDIVVEVMGGATFAYDCVKKALQCGKSVVTSNKELVATKGAELIDIAKNNNCNFLFEASVGGGIPVINPLNNSLNANEILEVCGILNGTTNYILTKMINEQVTFDHALKQAQQLGYAEKDPTADIDGHDTCRKICILAALAFKKHIYPEFVHTEGIRNVTLSDVACAAKFGMKIKLLGRTYINKDGKIYAIVAPFAMSGSKMLANVEDVYNAVSVSGNAVGDTMFYGRGAGDLPTASAVVSDIIDCVKHLDKRADYYWQDSDDSVIMDYKDNVTDMLVSIECDSVDQIKNELIEAFPKITFALTAKNVVSFIVFNESEKKIDSVLDRYKKEWVKTKIRVLK